LYLNVFIEKIIPIVIILYPQGATKLTKEDIEKVFSLYDRVSKPNN